MQRGASGPASVKESMSKGYTDIRNTETEPSPLIVTLRLDRESSRFFDRQRRAFFPPERNFLSAHVTLFHKLPGEKERLVRASLAGAASAQSAIGIAVEGLRFLGAGVAYRLAAPDLLPLHRALAARFEPWLTAQDRQPLRPHVTVQNKVAAETARALLDELQADFQPWTARGTGLDLWSYRGGPWTFVEHFPFKADTRAAP